MDVVKSCAKTTSASAAGPEMAVLDVTGQCVFAFTPLVDSGLVFCVALLASLLFDVTAPVCFFGLIFLAKRRRSRLLFSSFQQ